MTNYTYQNYFDAGELALAAYSDFSGTSRAVDGARDSLDVKRQLIVSGDFQSIEAQQFIDRFQVVDQFTDPSLLLNGFSATVFRNRQTNQLYFITRGTENSGDYLADGTLAIGITARSQIISMVNYFLRLEAGAGNVARQIKASSILPSDSVEWDQSKTVLGVGAGLNLNQLIVAGHSLGGYLATIFGRIFNSKIATALTFNSPGAYGGFGLLDNIARLIGGAPNGFLDAGRQTNLVGDYIISAVPGRRGQTVRIFEEGDAHSQKSVVDALAIYSLLGELDPNIGVGAVRDIARASANKDPDSLEAALDGLRKLILGASVAATKQPGTAETDAIRETFYQNVDGIRESAPFQASVGQVSVVSLVGRSGEEINSLAHSDVGYRYALKELSQFAIAFAPELYDQHNGNGELDLDDAGTGQGTLTSEWLRDRAQFLTWKNQKNLNDIADGVSILRKDNGVQSYLYTDKTLKDSLGQEYSIRVVGGNVLQQIDPIRISFASDQGDTLQGGNYGDHLYGGRGSDSFAGGDGNDYLEGGAGDDTLGGDAGDDTLIGGSGVDTLDGGADNDILQGGKGDDILQGAAGDDVYLIRAGDGRDTIFDHEGRNAIIYTDASGKRSVLAVSAFAVAGLSNSWNGYLAGGGSISFTRNSPLTATLPDGGQIVIDGYQDGDFGIQLKDIAQSDPETTGLTLLGDLEPVPVYPIYNSQGEVVAWDYDEDELGNIITDPSKPAPDREDCLFGSDDNDFIAGFGGEDWIYGGGGADRLQGGTGADYIYGEDGDDVIEGQDDTSTDTEIDRISGGAGDDWIFAAAECDIEDAIAHANDADFDGNSARIMGEAGDDVIVGSTGRDCIAGGAGGDVLIGGGGGDLIGGDADFWSLFTGQLGSNQGSAADDADTIYGGGGGDSIRGGLGDDYVDGGDGDDFIFGEGGSDTLFGGAGDDSIFAIVNETNLVVFDESDDYIDGGDGNDWICGSAGDNLLLGGGGNDEIVGAGGDDYIEGGDGNDRLEGNDAHGGADDDQIAGTAGADTLYGDDGNDVLGGWSWLWQGSYVSGYVVSADTIGDDWLYGGAGDDTYLFERGAGSGHIVDDSGVNRIVLMSYEISSTDPGVPDMYAPIAADSIRFEVEDGAYKLLYGDAGDSIDFGSSLGGATPIVELNRVGLGVYYDDNTDPEHLNPRPALETVTEAVSWSGIELSQSSAPEGGTLTAIEGVPNMLIGKEGDDVIIGASREDELTGGPGGDFLDGGEGGDRYVFNAGDGVDVVSDSGAQGTDTLVFGPGISPDALSLGTDALLIRIGESGDVVYVDGFDPDHAEAAGGIERFEFADGTVLSHAQLVSRGFDLRGSDGDDTAFGTNLVDRFHESAGNDSLIGGAGDDIYYFGVGSGDDFVVDQDATPNNLDTVMFGSGITAENLSVVSSAGLLTFAVAGTDDALAVQWRPQDGYAIERIQFADSTIWDSAMLESMAGPVVSADAGTGATDSGGALPTETPPTDTETAEPVGSDTTEAANGAMPPADTGSADAGTGTPAAGETSETGAGSATAAEAGPGEAAAEAPTGDNSNQLAGGGAPPAENALPDAEIEIPMAGDTNQIGSSETPPPEIVTVDAGAGTTTGDATNQTATGATPAPAGTPESEVAVPTSGNAHQAAGGATPAADSAQAEAGGGTATDGNAAQIDHGDAAPPAVAVIDAGSEAQTGGDTSESANAGTTPAETGTVDAAAGAPAGGGTVQTGSVEAPILDVGSLGAEATPSANEDTIATGIDLGSAAGGRDSARSPGVPASSGSATALPNLQSTSLDSRQDALLAALRLIGASEFGTAAELPRSSAKPLYAVDAQFMGGHSAFTPNPASFFAALRPQQPSMQAWLDNWFGPRARAATGSRENAPASEVEDPQLPPEQDFAPLNLPDDLPEDQPEATLTSEEIAQSYQDIATWLKSNPGIEQDTTGSIGSPPQKNLFMIAAPGSAGDGGLESMAWLSQSPGMAAIGGEALQPLRGIQDGYTVLAVM